MARNRQTLTLLTSALNLLIHMAERQTIRGCVVASSVFNAMRAMLLLFDALSPSWGLLAFAALALTVAT